MRALLVVVSATLWFACGKHEKPAPPPPPPAKPIRGAVGDTDLRVMLAELASAKACEMMKGDLRSLNAKGRPDLTTGVLWIRDCKISNDRTNVTFHLAGLGWQWTDKVQKKAGGTFEVHDYAKFAVDATLEGNIDIAYDTKTHVMSLWYSPTKSPDVKFTPLAALDVDAKGVWSSVLGELSSAFGDSPEEQSKDQAKVEGTEQFQNQLVQGLTVAVNLCTGYQRISTGRPPKGQLGPENPGESLKRAVEFEPGGLLAFGPYSAHDGMHVSVKSDGPIRVGVACADAVYPVAEAYVNGKPEPPIKMIAEADVNGTGSLAVKSQRCKVAVVARSLAKQKVTFEFQRPPREIAQSTGGAMIHCARDQEVSSGRHGPPGRAAARRR